MEKKAMDLVRLRQTCCLGLPSEILLPQILAELHRIIDSERIHFAWTDDLGNIVNAYFEKPDPVALNYAQNNFYTFQEEIGVSVRRAILFGKATGNYRWPYRPGFEKTEGYARLFEALGLKYSLDGVIRDRFRPLGQIVLFRRHDEPDFTVAEERTLARTLPYIAHAITSRQKSPEAFVETGDTGLLVFDSSGKLIFQSAQAKELCLYALHEKIPAGQGGFLGQQETEARLHDLYLQVLRIESDSAPGASPPAWLLKNKWGEFQLRAYVLQSSEGHGSSYGITVERKVPIEMQMLQKVKEMPLSNKQREVCFLLLRGVDNEQIAQMLGIKPTTLKEHTQAIYRKLGVGKRDELFRLAMA